MRKDPGAEEAKAGPEYPTDEAQHGRLHQQLSTDGTGVAPSALRSPISRMRSVTDTSMMFITPMPPTSSEMPAIPPRSMVSVLSTEWPFQPRSLGRDGVVGVGGIGDPVQAGQFGVGLLVGGRQRGRRGWPGPGCRPPSCGWSHRTAGWQRWSSARWPDRLVGGGRRAGRSRRAHRVEHPDHRHGHPLMVTGWPIGSRRPNSSSAVVDPRTTTSAREVTS